MDYYQLWIKLWKRTNENFKKRRFKFLFNHAVQKVNSVKNGVQLDVKNKKGEIVSVEGDYCLVAVGRKAYTEKLGLENIGLETDKAGRVITDNNLQTSVKKYLCNWRCSQRSYVST
jgi:dihydrolipoamide dehydrogenase